MITGDNALTGCNIAYQCKIADTGKKMLILDFKDEARGIVCEEFNFDPNSAPDFSPAKLSVDENGKEIEMKLIEREKEEDIYGASQANNRQAHDGQANRNADIIREVIEKVHNGNTQLCLTGSAFDNLFDGSLDEVQ